MDSFFNLDSFILSEPSKEEDVLCHVCSELTYGQAYFHEDSDGIQYWFHESCTKLPRHTEHPLHPHPLILLSEDDEFICNACRDLSKGFRFSCKPCRFNVDVRCDSLTDFSKYDHHALELRDRRANIDHFCHQHTLKRCNISIQNKFNVNIDGCYCSKKVDGSNYVCLDCKFSIHESCMVEMQREVQHPYHPQHTLLAGVIDKNIERKCNACRGQVKGIGLTCEQCSFNLHYPCAEPKLIPFLRPLKQEYHEHDLFYFRYAESYNTASCCICQEDLNSSFYRCVECDVNFHLKCMPILPIDEVKCLGDHPLKLVDSVRGHDFNEYYCDVCEEIGNAMDHLYYCEECSYFVHIDCAVTKLSEVSEERNRNVRVNHFSHRHTLKQCFLSEKRRYICCYCNQIIFGLHYVCLDCQFFIHDSCRDQLREKEEIRHPYHPQHPLYDCPEYNNHYGHDYERICYACRGKIKNIGLWCEDCCFDLHYGCANKPLLCPLKPICHKHNLFSGDESTPVGIVDYDINDELSNSSMFSCVDCYVSFNFKGIPNLLSVVEVKCHNTHLLSESVTECNYEEYSCNVCNERGSIDDPLYRLEECAFFKKCTYFTHIDCFITKIENDLSFANTETKDKVKEEHTPLEDQTEELGVPEEKSGMVEEVKDHREEHQESDAEESNFGQLRRTLMKEEVSKLGIDAEVTKICTEMEALATKLGNLQSVILSSREKIMEALSTFGESN